MSLLARIHSPGRAANRRTSSRRRLRLEVQGTGSTGSGSEARIHDLSATGLLLETTAKLAAGEEISVDLPHAGSTDAEVVWHSGNLFGCRFREPISSAALSAAQLLSPLETGTANRTRDADIPEHFGARLRRLRKEADFTIVQLARALQVSRPTIWNWEAGNNQPSAANLENLARALGVSPHGLLSKNREKTDRADLAQAVETSATEIEMQTERRFGPPVSYEARLTQLIAASKVQIAAQAGTTPDKVKIILEL